MLFHLESSVTGLTDVFHSIIQDEHVQQPGGPIGGGVLDIRRVSALSEVSVDQPETGLQPGIVSA